MSGVQGASECTTIVQPWVPAGGGPALYDLVYFYHRGTHLAATAGVRAPAHSGWAAALPHWRRNGYAVFVGAMRTGTALNGAHGLSSSEWNSRP